MILAKQDRIALLEEELNKVDREEEKELWLGNMRRDKNQQREHVFSQLDEALKDYGNALDQFAFPV